MIMDRLQHLLTERVRELIVAADELRPDFPVVFEIMPKDDPLQRSAGAATVTDSLGNEIIYVDPLLADEYMIAHEIMHLILHRSGWPQMYCIIPVEYDSTARRLADDIDNSLDHYVFNPRLETLGFDVKRYREWFLSVLEEWPDTKVTVPNLLWNALKILDGFLFSQAFRKRILKIVASKQTESLALARQLQHKASPAKTRNKSGVRRAMVAMLDFLEEWITEQSGSVQNLRQRIGISPLFTKAQLLKSASTIIEFESHPMVLNSERLWLGGLVLKSDGTRFRNYTGVGAVVEPPEFENIRQHLQTHNVKEFIETENIRKFGTFP